MKKIKLLIFSLLAMFIFIPSVFAKANVEITNVELEELNGVAEEINSPEFKDLDLKFDIKFNEVNDSVKYKVTIKNNDDIDYKVLLESDGKSENIVYEYTTDESIASNSETTVYINVKYDKAITNFADGKYNEKSNASLKLLNESNEESIENPETGVYGYIGIIAVILVVAFVVNKKVSNKNKFKMMSVLLILAASPLMVKAYEATLELNVVANIEVAQENTFCIYNNYRYGIEECAEIAPKKGLLGKSNEQVPTDYILYITYENGMTWHQFESSKYVSAITETYSELNEVILENVHDNFRYGSLLVKKEFVPQLDNKSIYDILDDNFDSYLERNNISQSDFDSMTGDKQNELFDKSDKEVLLTYGRLMEDDNNKIIPSSQGCYVPDYNRWYVEMPSIPE